MSGKCLVLSEYELLLAAANGGSVAADSGFFFAHRGFFRSRIRFFGADRGSFRADGGCNASVGGSDGPDYGFRHADGVYRGAGAGFFPAGGGFNRCGCASAKLLTAGRRQRGGRGCLCRSLDPAVGGRGGMADDFRAEERVAQGAGVGLKLSRILTRLLTTDLGASCE